MDESGFEETTFRRYGWSGKGQKIYGDQPVNRSIRTNLIAGKSGKKLLAPRLFEGATNASWFNTWLQEHLFKELPEGATVIMDNAAFHKTPQTRKIFDQSPFHLLYLPPYSPDLNPIEKVFANLKKRRQYAPTNTPLGHFVKSYGDYLE